jgi:putative membrane protein
MRIAIYLDKKERQIMQIISTIAVALIALLHVYIMILEMFLWNTPKGRKVFGLSPEFAAASRVLAANQGLYNGFLAAGLVWGLILGPAGYSIKMFFLACIVVAGIFGALTSSKKILYVQAIPGFVALILLVLSGA